MVSFKKRDEKEARLKANSGDVIQIHYVDTNTDIIYTHKNGNTWITENPTEDIVQREEPTEPSDTPSEPSEPQA